jgi:hypothetical protein
MSIEFGLTKGPVNTQYAPLAALSAHYQQNQTLKPLQEVQIPFKERDFKASGKLIRVLLSILVGCETLSEVNIRLKSERDLAKVRHWERCATARPSGLTCFPAISIPCIVCAQSYTLPKML